MPDGSSLVLAATERVDEVGAQVWRVAYPSGEAARITNDPQDHGEESLGVTADGRTILTTIEQRLSRIETIPATGDINQTLRLTQVEGNQEGLRGFDFTPDGRLVFSTFEGGQSDIWIMNANGSARRRLTSDIYFESGPTVSPDGRYVVFASNRPDGKPVARLWRMDIDGGNPVQLSENVNSPPNISPDGRWVIYSVWSAEKPQSVWKLSVDGGQAVRLTDYPSNSPSYSPDGQWIGCYYDDPRTEKWDYGIISASDGKPIRQFDFPGFQYQWVRWTPDSRYLSFIGVPPDPSNIWLQPAEGGAPRKLTDFKQDYIFRHAWSRDGKTLALVRGRPTSDVVLLKDNR
jgi:Tol biopolymer transport system component